MKYARLILLLSMLGMAACAGRGDKETVGGLTGAALGGLLGAQFGSGSDQLASTAVGVLLGGLVGSEVGRSMDEMDRMKANEAVLNSHSAPLGEKIHWNKPDSGYHGSITPVRDGYSGSGNYCREFHQSVSIGGSTEEVYGTTCRKPGGTWRIVQ